MDWESHLANLATEWAAYCAARKKELEQQKQALRELAEYRWEPHFVSLATPHRDDPDPNTLHHMRVKSGTPPRRAGVQPINWAETAIFKIFPNRVDIVFRPDWDVAIDVSRALREPLCFDLSAYPCKININPATVLTGIVHLYPDHLAVSSPEDVLFKLHVTWPLSVPKRPFERPLPGPVPEQDSTGPVPEDTKQEPVLPLPVPVPEDTKQELVLPLPGPVPEDTKQDSTGPVPEDTQEVVNARWEANHRWDHVLPPHDQVQHHIWSYYFSGGRPPRNSEAEPNWGCTRFVLTSSDFRMELVEKWDVFIDISGRDCTVIDGVYHYPCTISTYDGPYTVVKGRASLHPDNRVRVDSKDDPAFWLEASYDPSRTVDTPVYSDYPGFPKYDRPWSWPKQEPTLPLPGPVPGDAKEEPGVKKHERPLDAADDDTDHRPLKIQHTQSSSAASQ